MAIDISRTGLPYETRQRMEAARAQGIPEDEIQRHISRDLYRSQINRMRDQGKRKKSSKSREKEGGFKIFGIDPTAWIREIGGSAGAVGGAAAGATAGSALLPGIGTLLGGIGGGILGAFGGGTAGSAAEQQVREGRIDTGKMFREGLQEAPWGALPGVGKAASVVKNAPRGARTAALLGKTDDATQVSGSLAEEAVRATGRKFGKRPGNVLQRSGASMRQGVINPQVSASPRMASKQREIAETLQRLGFKGSASKQLNQLDDASRVLSRQVDDALKANKNTVDIKSITADLRRHATGNLEATPAVQRELKRTLADITQKAKSGNMYDLRQAQKKLGDRLGRAFDKLKRGGTLTDKEMVDLEVWGKLDDVLRANAGDAKQLLRDHSILFDASKGISREAGRTIGLPLANISSGTLARGSQATRDLTGRALQRTGDALSFSGGRTAGFASNPVVRQTAIRAGGGALLGDGQQPQEQVNDPFGLGLTEEQIISAAQQAGIAPEEMLPLLGIQQDPLAGELGGFTADNMITNQMVADGQLPANAAEIYPQQAGLVIPREAMLQAMMADLEATGGANLDQMQKIFEFANADALLAQEQAGGAELTADQEKKLTGIANVEVQLAELQNYVDSGLFPDTENQLSATLGGFFDTTIGRLTDTDKKIFQDQLRSRGIQIIRAMGEVGNLTEAEQDAAVKNLPSPGDTYQGAQKKLNDLARMFAGVKENVLTFGGTVPGQTGANASLLGGFGI